MKRWLAFSGGVLACMMMAHVVSADTTTVGTISNGSEAGAYGTFNMSFGGGGDPAPYAPGVVTGPVSSPTLFNVQGLPANVKGLPMLANNFFSTAHHDVAIGCSDGTKIIYTSADVQKKPDNKERKIHFNFNGVANGEIIGSLTIHSRKNKADEVDIPTLIYDATHYVNNIHDLKGYNITLLSLQNAIAYSLGVDTRASGFALSPFVSGFVNGPAGVLTGLAAGGSRSGGVTVPTATVGCTFLVLVDSEKSRRVDIRKNYNVPIPEDEATMNSTGAAPSTPSAPNATSSTNTSNRKKFEATKEK